VRAWGRYRLEDRGARDVANRWATYDRRDGVRKPRIIRLQSGAGWLSFSTDVPEFLSLSGNDRAFLDALAEMLDKYERLYPAMPSGGAAREPQREE